MTDNIPLCSLPTHTPFRNQSSRKQRLTGQTAGKQRMEGYQVWKKQEVPRHLSSSLVLWKVGKRSEWRSFFSFLFLPFFVFLNREDMFVTKTLQYCVCVYR